MRLKRTAALGLVAAMLGLGLTACAEPPPTPSPGPAATQPVPVLDSEQESSVLTQIGQTLQEAEKELDPKLLGTRLSGPALLIRKSELAVAKTAETKDLISPVPTELESIMVPATDEWPRTAFAISVPPELQTQRLLVVQQSSARAKYKLWGWVDLFPTVELPSFATPEVGSPQIAPDADGLLMTPTDAVEAYADVLNKGKKSKSADVFGSDPFRDYIAENSKLQNEALKPADGKQTMTFTPVKNEVVALGSVEGGAIIVGELAAVEDRIAEERAILSPSTPVEKALTKKLKIKNSMSLGFTTIVAMHIPPAGSSDTVTVVGVKHVATSAEIPK